VNQGNYSRLRRLPSPGPARGLSLVFALMALAAMMLAAVALVRSVDSGALVLGNLGFKQETTSAADRAAEEARALVVGGAINLEADDTTVGYYATSQENLDPTGRVTSASNLLAVVDWRDADSCACFNSNPKTCASCSRTPSNVRTYDDVKTSFVITRLCPNAGAPSATNACAKPAAAALSNASERGSLDPTGPRPSTTVIAPYYRIIVRSVGARGTVSFTETIVY